jgi:hypothetical protein
VSLNINPVIWICLHCGLVQKVGFQLLVTLQCFFKLQMLYAPFLKNAFLNSYWKQEGLALLANWDSDV